jgi:NAD(P)-dependent dehydrogenase (short-subunit alcohol dehydrogenase family)
MSLQLTSVTAPVAVITGTTHGIGAVTARELARAGFTVVMLVRDPDAGQRQARLLTETVSGACIEVIACDLASLASVAQAGAQVRQRHAALTLLINNAGRVTLSRQLSVDGYELTFATNHLGPFLLTELLRPAMASAARIVSVASCVHVKGKADFDRVPQALGPYSAQAAYARSKLANVMHTLALARRVGSDGPTVNCLHPGVVASNLLPRWLQIIKPWITPVTFDNERGARSSLHVALHADFATRTGCYVDEYQQVVAPAALARDIEQQERLWALSAQWVRAFLPAV